MGKKVNSETVSLWDILATSTVYSIPYNQRPYTWGLKNWETLWNSFFSLNDKSTFLGTIILLESEDEDFEDEIQVFDGQQRITTLTIMCKAFIDVLYDSNDIDEASQIKSYLLTDAFNIPRLKVSKNLSDYFVNNIQASIEVKPSDGSSDAEKTIFKAYQYFKKLAYELHEKNNFKGQATHSILKKRLKTLEIVKLTISDVVLGIEIFESVNATGEKLNASELAKNILIKHAYKSDKHKMEVVDSEWTEVSDRLNALGFSFIDFMHYYWISKYPYVGKSQLFNAMKDKFEGNSAAWLEFFELIKATSITIENILSLYSFDNFKLHYPKANSNPKYSSKYLRYLRCLRFIKNKSWIIPIFTLFNYETNLNKRGESYIGGNKLHEILKKHFVFSFLHFNIFSLPTRDFTPAMYKLSKNINKAFDDSPQDAKKSNKAVNDALQFHFKNNDSYVTKATKNFTSMTVEFFEGIHKLRHTRENKFLIHSLYGDIEEGIYGGTFHDIASHSVEHYMPQESEDSWGIAKSLSKHHENRLGNILIINASLNGRLQNKSHGDKIDILREDPTLNNSVKDFIRQNDNQNGLYDFGKISVNNLKKSNPPDSQSEIDKRTIVIGKHLNELYIKKMKY